MASIRAHFLSHPIATEIPQDGEGLPDLIAESVFIEELWRVNGSLGSLSFSGCFGRPFPLSIFVPLEARARYAHLFQPGATIAFAQSEPDVGSNPAELRTTAVPHGTGWLLNGHKQWILHVPVSDAMLVVARVPDEGLALFLADRREQDYVGDPLPCHGLNGVASCDVVLDDYRVPAEGLLTAPGDGLRAAMSFLETARLNLASGAVGLAQAALDDAIDYVGQREQFGRTLANFQLVQVLVADMAIGVETARGMLYRALARVQGRSQERRFVAMAKAYCTETAVRVASMNVQVHGAMGLSRESAAERYLRDTRMLTIPDETTQIQKLIIGRELLGVSAFT